MMTMAKSVILPLVLILVYGELRVDNKTYLIETVDSHADGSHDYAASPAHGEDHHQNFETVEHPNGADFSHHSNINDDILNHHEDSGHPESHEHHGNSASHEHEGHLDSHEHPSYHDDGVAADYANVRKMTDEEFNRVNAALPSQMQQAYVKLPADAKEKAKEGLMKAYNGDIDKMISDSQKFVCDDKGCKMPGASPPPGAN